VEPEAVVILAGAIAIDVAVVLALFLASRRRAREKRGHAES